MSEFEKYMKNRNVIDRVQHTNVTKKELIALIDKAFPDEEVGNHGQIAQITTTEMTTQFPTRAKLACKAPHTCQALYCGSPGNVETGEN